MKIWFSTLMAALLAMATFVGCAPEADRTPTTVKDSADVKIEYEVEPAAEEDSSSSGNESTAAKPAASSSTETTVAATDTPASARPSAESATDSAAASENKKEMAATEQAAASSANADYTGPAKFTGRVVVKGAPPEFPPLLAKGAPTKDLVCSEEPVPNEKAVVSSDGGLANVFVFMKKAPSSGVPPAEGDAPVVDQEGCVFLPHAAIVRVGQTVVLKNSDPVAHNVNVKGFQNQYNNVVPANGSVEHTFQFAERFPAPTGCDFHTFMAAYILPLDHPWGAVTDENGNFEISNLPDGEWDFVIWHEAVGYVERSVSVTAAANTVVDKVFEVDATKLSQ